MKRFAIVAALGAVLFSSAVRAADPVPTPAPPADIKDVIKGTMKIDFQTVKNLDTSGTLKDGSPALGAKDIYTTDITVANLTRYQGTIQRQPNLYKKGVGYGDFRVKQDRKQDAELYFDLNIFIKTTAVGKFVGVVPINTETGAYDFGGGASANSPLRMDIDTVGRLRAYRENAGGQLVGKTENKTTLHDYIWKRVMPDGKVTSIVIKKNDPMHFNGLVLPHGPTDNYFKVTVNGDMNYDYEKGNYFVDNLAFSYIDPVSGKDQTDRWAGTIKWIKDANYHSNGKSHYQFNLTVNAPQPKGDEAAIAAPVDDESAIDAPADPSVGSLSGEVDYVDTRTGDLNSDDAAVTDSNVDFHLNSHNLRKEQVMAWAKVWCFATVGPVNDP